jgi:hypothetical protein
MAWCLVKPRDNFTLPSVLRSCFTQSIHLKLCGFQLVLARKLNRRQNQGFMLWRPLQEPSRRYLHFPNLIQILVWYSVRNFPEQKSLHSSGRNSISITEIILRMKNDTDVRDLLCTMHWGVSRGKIRRKTRAGPSIAPHSVLLTLCATNKIM